MAWNCKNRNIVIRVCVKKLSSSLFIIYVTLFSLNCFLRISRRKFLFVFQFNLNPLFSLAKSHFKRLASRNFQRKYFHCVDIEWLFLQLESKTVELCLL